MSKTARLMGGKLHLQVAAASRKRGEIYLGDCDERNSTVESACVISKRYEDTVNLVGISVG